MIKQAKKTSKPKVVTVVARITLKRNGHIVYQCRGSHGDIYLVTVIAGRATGCTCPAYKPCKHMEHCQLLECARVENIAANAESANMQKLMDHRIGNAYEEAAAQIHEHASYCNECGLLARGGVCGYCAA